MADVMATVGPRHNGYSEVYVEDEYYVKKPVIMNELLARLRCGQRILNLERRLKTLAGEQATAFMEELT